nr:MAG TPA: hypothetical protein [Caudoviricetes sp.]
MYSLFTHTLKRSEIVWQQWEMHFFGASSVGGALFYCPYIT